jgi:hypothetical protein
MGNKGNISIQYQHGFIIVANSSSINFFVFPAREEKKKKKRSKGDCQADEEFGRREDRNKGGNIVTIVLY